MSSPVNGDDERLALDHFFRCLSNSILSREIEVASAVLILYDWVLTSGDEFTFVWRRSKNYYARILFICARYPALASAIWKLRPVRPAVLTVYGPDSDKLLRIAGPCTMQCYDVAASHHHHLFRGYPRDEGMGYMAKESENAHVPHNLYHSMETTHYTCCALITQPVEGMYSTSHRGSGIWV
ncbi:hypothetical protein BC826DRAFT_138370 [Russula brevipes]|nr:hypothetical protein BC826DRAFT_138370 [Russula brevipes]